MPPIEAYAALPVPSQVAPRPTSWRQGVVLMIGGLQRGSEPLLEALREGGLRVAHEPSTRSGLALVGSSLVPRLAVLGEHGAHLDLVELCRRTRRASTRRFPIVALAEKLDLGRLVALVDAGADDVLLPESAVETMVERVRTWARRPDRAADEDRRRRARASIEEEIEERALQAEAGKGPPVETLLDHLPASMRALACRLGRVGGTPVRRHLVLLGYASGLVRGLSRRSLLLQLELGAGLRTVVLGAGLLPEQDMATFVKGLTELQTDPGFAAAAELGERDADRLRLEDDEGLRFASEPALATLVRGRASSRPQPA